ncbi:hypothetical protein NPIL_668051 [Nephila pilipes]|uniref:Uncharacterized protein n=1 Tax=Nephila pilipes TaxID=299642 RepID=A0A8X6TTG4_NEPPI|nr:hypothetical protein NPIL_668051 [Nephila pilipes]
MSRKKVFKTAEEAVEYLFSEELEFEMIVLPPEVDEFTDEEGFDDSETLDPSILSWVVVMFPNALVIEEKLPNPLFNLDRIVVRRTFNEIEKENCE